MPLLSISSLSVFSQFLINLLFVLPDHAPHPQTSVMLNNCYLFIFLNKHPGDRAVRSESGKVKTSSGDGAFLGSFRTDQIVAVFWGWGSGGSSLSIMSSSRGCSSPPLPRLGNCWFSRLPWNWGKGYENRTNLNMIDLTVLTEILPFLLNKYCLGYFG